MVNKSPGRKEYTGISQQAVPQEKFGDPLVYEGHHLRQPLENEALEEDHHVSVSQKLDRNQIMKKTWAVIVLVALPLLLVAITLGWIIVPCFIRYQISSKVAISPEVNPELYAAWLHPPIPVYLKVYLFNVTNPEQVRRGALPKLQEVGPYVFLENRTKVDITHDEASDTITYKEFISFHFQPELSGNARLSDVVTIVNVPFAAAAIKIAHDLPWPLNTMAETILVSYKEPLFVQKTIEEAAFKGWTVPFLERMEEELGMQLIPNNKFGFFVGENATTKGPFTISRGIHDTSTFGMILKFKNESTIDFWGDRSLPCNQIMGTDGTLFPPFVNKGTILRLFNAELCRSLYLTYDKDTQFNGIKGYRFTAPPTIIEDPREGQENRCFCPDLEQFPDKCLKQGAFNLGPCRDGAPPIAMSLPHFLDANPEYINNSGLTPNRDKHETYMEIEPLTGLILHASKKIQINLIMKPVKSISALKKLPDILFPLVWADETAALDQENTDKFKNMLFQLWLLDFLSKWVLLGVALIISLVLIVRRLRFKHERHTGNDPGSVSKMNLYNLESSQQVPLRSSTESDEKTGDNNQNQSHC